MAASGRMIQNGRWIPGKPARRWREQDDAERAEVRRGEERRRVRADRVEGHIAEVEQPGEPGHDVQPDGHDPEDQHERDDRVVRERQREDVPAEPAQELLVEIG